MQQLGATYRCTIRPFRGLCLPACQANRRALQKRMNRSRCFGRVERVTFRNHGGTHWRYLVNTIKRSVRGCDRWAMQPVVTVMAATDRIASQINKDRQAKPGRYFTAFRHGHGQRNNSRFSVIETFSRSLLHTGWRDVTESMVTIGSPFCGYNLA